MTDRTEAEEFFETLLDSIEEARIALAKALDKENVDPRLGIIALEALKHQAFFHLDSDDQEFVEKVGAVVMEAINEAENHEGVIH